MIKKELIEALEPYDDDTEIRLYDYNWDKYYKGIFFEPCFHEEKTFIRLIGKIRKNENIEIRLEDLPY